MIKKIALTGKANTGKNTAAKLIIKALKFEEWQYALMAFADPIKEMIIEMFPWADKNCLYGSSELRSNIIPKAFDSNGNPLTYRQALIDLGTQGRKYNPNHWIEVFDYRVKNSFDPKLILCTDVRFRNEFDYLKENGYSIFKITRSSVATINHSTETNQDSIGLHEFDYVLNNDGSIIDLENNILKALG